MNAPRDMLKHGVPALDINPADVGYHLPLDLDTQIFLWRNLGSTMELATQYLKDYIHTSHRDIPLTWLDRVGNAPDPSGQRQVFPNQPQHATPPQPSPAKPPTCAP